MSGTVGHDATRNRLLAALLPDDFGRLEPHLEHIALPVGKRLERRNRRIDHVYFIQHGMASVVADGKAEGSIEVGVIGREGVSGLAVILGTDRSPHETFMQLAGDALCLSAENLRAEMRRSDSLRQTLLLFGHAFLVQVAQTALANGRSKIEERLARWLLMAHDRMDADEVSLTHEFLATMLGVRRPGVTIALNLLERKGLIRIRRAVIRIPDREGLKRASNGCYGAAEAEYSRLFA